MTTTSPPQQTPPTYAELLGALSTIDILLSVYENSPTPSHAEQKGQDIGYMGRKSLRYILWGVGFDTRPANSANST